MSFSKKISPIFMVGFLLTHVVNIVAEEVIYVTIQEPKKSVVKEYARAALIGVTTGALAGVMQKYLGKRIASLDLDITSLDTVFPGYSVLKNEIKDCLKAEQYSLLGTALFSTFFIEPIARSTFMERKPTDEVIIAWIASWLSYVAVIY